MKIFIGLRDTASNESGLKHGFDQLGVKSYLCLLENNKCARSVPSSKPAWVERLAGDYRDLAATPLNTGFAKRLRQRAMLVCKWRIFFWALMNCDAFILGYRSTFFSFRELLLLRLMKKRVIYVFYGSDSRPPYMDGNWINEPAMPVAELAALTRETADAVATIERRASIVVNRPVHAQFHRRPFVNKEIVGRPCNVEDALLPDSGADGVSRAVRILHAPSVSKAKGTDHIRNVIAQLEGNGLKIDYREITGQPNCVVLDAIRESDIVIDQAYADIPVAGLGTEAAFFGRCALVGGYAAGLPANDASGCPTTLFVQPHDMLAVAGKLVREPAFRIESAAKMHAFVTKNWTSKIVADRFVRLARNDIPAGWIAQPHSARYFRGCGADESRVAASVRDLVKFSGPSTLALDHDSALRDELIAWSAAHSPAKPPSPA